MNRAIDIVATLVFVSIVLLFGHDFGYDKVAVVLLVFLNIAHWNLNTRVIRMTRGGPTRKPQEAPREKLCDYCGREATDTIEITVGRGHPKLTNRVCVMHKNELEALKKKAAQKRAKK